MYRSLQRTILSSAYKYEGGRVKFERSTANVPRGGREGEMVKFELDTNYMLEVGHTTSHKGGHRCDNLSTSFFH